MRGELLYACTRSEGLPPFPFRGSSADRVPPSSGNRPPEGVIRMRALRGTLLSLLCGWLVLPAVKGAGTPSADEVLQKSRATYSALKSYEDKGSVEVEFGQAGSQVRERHSFRTAYKAPRQFLFDFTK